MTTDKVRIIHTTTGKVKWVTPLVASDIKQLFAEGFIIQNLPKKEDPEAIKEPVKETKIDNVVELEPLDLLNLPSNPVAIEENTAKGKPGRKPNPKQ